MRFLVLKSDINGIVASTIIEFCDATLCEDVFLMKISSSNDDLIHTSSSIPDHVKMMTNMGQILLVALFLLK